MTVARLEDEMPQRELMEWPAFLIAENAAWKVEEDKRQRAQERETARGTGGGKKGPR